MRRVVVAASVAVGFLLASNGGASAAVTYCDWDPLVLVITPAGHIVPTFDSVWTASPLSLGLPLESYTAKRVWHGGRPMTQVDVTIYVPAGLLFRFATADEVTTGLLGSGTVLASGSGTSGAPVHLEYTLTTP